MSNKLTVVSPYDEHTIDEIPLSDEKSIINALTTAEDLSKNRAQWLPKHERVEILYRVIDIMKSRVDDLTKIAVMEGGKPYVDSKIEVERAINGVKLAIEYMGVQAGKEVPMGHTKSSENRMALTIKEPIGIVVSISAFNHPLNLVIHQTIPAIAAGCPVIIKPALTTPMSCFNFIDILKEAGLPEQWCQAFVCDNDAAEKLVVDNRVGYLSFIGSAKVGWWLRSKLAPGTRYALEHGGSAPVIFEKDADVDSALPLLLKGGFYHAGQVCVSVQRIFVEESIVDEVTARLVEKAGSLITGDPLDEKTDVGPLILPREVDRVELWVNEAADAGGEILCGGKRLSDTSYAPTVILNPPAGVKVSTEEIFGPVMCVYTYKNREKAIELANSLPYAFQASVFTKDIDVALDVSKKLDAAAVMINDHTAFRVDWMPFGGRKVSGIGVGGIPYSMDEMSQDKLIVIKSSVL